MQKNLYWNGTLRFFLQQYVPIVISSLINLENVSLVYDNFLKIIFQTPFTAISSIVAIALLVAS